MTDNKLPESVESWVAVNGFDPVTEGFRNDALRTFLAEQLQVLTAERDALRLRVAELSGETCKSCDGSGYVQHETGGIGPDGENDTRECHQEMCPDCKGTGQSAKGDV